MNIDIPHGIMLTVSMIFKVRKPTTSEKIAMGRPRPTQVKSQFCLFKKMGLDILCEMSVIYMDSLTRAFAFHKHKLWI